MTSTPTPFIFPLLLAKQHNSWYKVNIHSVLIKWIKRKKYCATVSLGEKKWLFGMDIFLPNFSRLIHKQKTATKKYKVVCLLIYSGPLQFSNLGLWKKWASKRLWPFPCWQTIYLSRRTMVLEQHVFLTKKKKISSTLILWHLAHVFKRASSYLISKREWRTGAGPRLLESLAVLQANHTHVLPSPTADVSEVLPVPALTSYEY